MASIVECCEEAGSSLAIEHRLTWSRLFPEPEPLPPADLPIATPKSTAFGGVTVIVPCYNEQSIIAATVRKLTQLMRSTHRPYEIIVIDDGSTDATSVELWNCSEQPHLTVLRNENNSGYGFSIKRAVAAAKYETLVLTDADGTYPMERIPELLGLMDGADMVVGARTGETVRIPLARRPAKWVLRKLAEYLTRTRIPDLNSGLRVMKRSLVRRYLPLLPDGFSLTTTITLASLTHNHTVKFVPIDYAKRVGTSSIRPLRDTLNFLGLVVRTVMYFRPLKVFAPVSAAVLAAAVGVALISKLVFGQLADVTSVTLAIGSVQLLATGLLADLIDKRSPNLSTGSLA